MLMMVNILLINVNDGQYTVNILLIIVNTMVIIWLMMVKSNDWLVVEPPTPLTNDGQLVSWDDDIPNIYGKIIQVFQTTNQIRWTR